MSDTNNNIPTRITQLEEATEYEDGMFFAVAKAGRGTYKIPVDEMTPNEQALSDKIENEIVPAVENSFAYGTVDESEIASFTDGSDLPMPKLEVAVEPQQDLHGYDSPWVGGSGRNLFSVGSRVDGTIADVRYTSDDEYIYLNGTKQGVGYADLSSASNITLDSGTYYIRAFVISGTASNTVELYPYDGTNNLTGNTINNERIFTLSESKTFRFRFAIWSDGTVLNNYKVGIVISKTANIDKFYPYSNICPISGWSAVDVTVADDVDNPTTTKTITIQLGDTYYGGKLDVVSGVLTVDRLFADMGSLTWGKNQTYWYTSQLISNMKVYGYNEVPSLLCSTYKTVKPSDVVNGRAVGISNFELSLGGLMIYTGDLVNPPTGQLVYELATPLTIQLTPTQVSSLMGVNNIWANTGNINKVEYIRDLDIVINSLLERIAALEG